MYVVATSVLILFVLIFLGFFIGKREIVRRDCAPDLSNLVLKVTMPVTVFCSIVDQQDSGMLSSSVGMLALAALVHVVSLLIGMLAVNLLRIPDQEKGVWLYSCTFSNNGFMGLPLALAIYGNRGMFLMALSNVVTNFLIFSLGIRLLTRGYPVKEEISLRKMLVNNINIAVILGFVFCIAGIHLPAVIQQLLGYIADITSGLSMIVAGLSLSRLQLRAVLEDRKMFLLTAVRLLALPLAAAAVLRLLPLKMDDTMRSILILTAALPASSAQSMITEQYRTNTAAASRSVFLTTLFSVITIPLMMLLLQ